MVAEERYFQTGHGRLFYQPNPGPGSPAQYKGNSRVTGFTWNTGDITPVRNPSAVTYDEFDDVDEVRGDEERPSASIVTRFGLVHFILKQRCKFDVHVHFGACENPQDFASGWETGLVFESAAFTTKSSDDLVALEPGDRAMIMMTGEFSARKIWSLSRMSLAEKASAEINREVVKLLIGGNPTCGSCGAENDGNRILYAVAKGSGGGSPGLPPIVAYSNDYGATWAALYDIDTLSSTEQPSDAALVGNYIVVISNDSKSLHYASVDDLDTWTEVTTGFVTGGEPNSIFALTATQVWIAGDGGYIYFSDDVLSGVAVQDGSAGGAAGGVDLLDIFMVSAQMGVAVGKSGAVVVTQNGGIVWSAAETTPTVSQVNCIHARTAYSWIVGCDDGYVYYTSDGGVTWHTSAFPGAGAGKVYDIVFAERPSSPFGFLAHATATPRGRILRTIDGGASWYVLPEGAGTIPANDRIVTLAAGYGGNFVAGGGLADDATDGIIVIGAGLN